MPAVPSNTLGEDYANHIMQQYFPGQSIGSLREINNWIGTKKPYECLGITMVSLFPWINYQQKPWIARYAKMHAQKLRDETDGNNPYWYPQQTFDMSTEEAYFDPWE